MSEKKDNPMREIMIEKVTLNMGIGEPGERLEKGRIVLERISGTKAVVTKGKKRIPTWGVRPGLPIGLKTTLRKEKAEELLKRLLKAAENKLKASQFDKEGNVSFGIKEYIHIPGVKYDPSLGIFGLDVCVTLKRRGGYRTKRKVYRRGKIGKSHRITPEEAMEFFKNKFGVEIIEG